MVQGKLCNSAQDRFDKIMAYPPLFLLPLLLSFSGAVHGSQQRGASLHCMKTWPSRHNREANKSQCCLVPSVSWGGNCSYPLPSLRASHASGEAEQRAAGGMPGGGGPCLRLELPARMQHHLYTSLEDKPAQGNLISQCKMLRCCSQALDPSPFLFFEVRGKGCFGTDCCRSPRITGASASSISKWDWLPPGWCICCSPPGTGEALHFSKKPNHLTTLLLQLEAPLASLTGVIPFCPNSVKSPHSGVVT